ncbi:MAG: hypothetical protein WC505_08015 [Patescibacteria group bacterium]
MTTRERLKAELMECGFFDKDAEAVLEKAIPEIESLNTSYRITWDRPAEEYPSPVYRVMFEVTRRIALEWIDQNCPDEENEG